MAGLTFRQAVEAAHAALEELFRATSMGLRIQICFERDRDFFAGARVQAEEPCVWAALENGGRAVGVFSAGSRQVWGGKPVRYLSDLRIHPGWQGSSVLARGFGKAAMARSNDRRFPHRGARRRRRRHDGTVGSGWIPAAANPWLFGDDRRSASLVEFIRECGIAQSWASSTAGSGAARVEGAGGVWAAFFGRLGGRAAGVGGAVCV